MMPSKAEETTDRPLSQLINTATRSIHGKLNKLIMSRLSIALPPHAQDASNYVSGLLHITPIYITFESLWRNILDLEETNSDDAGADPEGSQPESTDVENRNLSDSPTTDDRVNSLLTNLYLPGLVRSQELQKDVISLTGWSSHTVAEHLDDAGESPVLGEFIQHIQHVVGERPHVLLAYAWVLYMALFSGGRIIRAALEKVDANFWIPASAHLASPRMKPRSATTNTTTKAVGGPLNFFSFTTTTLGDDDVGAGGGGGGGGAGNDEDLKTTFKQRLAGSEGMLTTDERDDIVQEARSIFAYMVRLVSELDDICDTDPQAGRMLSLRSRDSVVVEKERRAALALLAKRIAAEEREEE